MDVGTTANDTVVYLAVIVDNGVPKDDAIHQLYILADPHVSSNAATSDLDILFKLGSLGQ